MIPNRFRNCSFHLLYRTFHIKNKVNITKPVLLRLCSSQKPFETNLFPKINDSVNYKYYSQVETDLHEIKDHVDFHEGKQPSSGKVFMELENGFFHSILENMKQYKKYIFVNDENFLNQPEFSISEKEFSNIVNKSDWNCEDVEYIVQCFIKASVYCAKHLKLPMSDVLFKNLCMSLVQISNKLNDEQLITCLKILCIWNPCDSVKADNFRDLWKALDKACYLRIVKRTWDLDTFLYVTDLWYALKLTRLSEFVYKGQSKLSRKVLRFEPSQLVQMLFFINTCRKVQPGMTLYEYEYRLGEVLPTLTIEEIGIAASGFFKTQTTIKSQKLLSHMMKRLMDKVETTHDIIITAILKVIRYSYRPEIASDVNLLVTKLIPRMDSNTITGCVHITFTLTPSIIFNERAIDKLVERFLADPTKARLKDMERITFILSLFNYIPDSAPHVLKAIVSELEKSQREKEYNLFRHTLGNLLFYLSLFKVFPLDLISKVLEETWINETYGKHPYRIQRILLALDYNTEIECPDAKVPRLSDEKRMYMSKIHSYYIPEPGKKIKSLHDKLFMDLITTTDKIFGSKAFYLVHFPLPHFSRADIVYCLDIDNKPVPIPEDMRNTPFFSGILKPTLPGNWRCLVVGGRSMYNYNGQRLVGEEVTKIRQLKIIGYTPVIIPWFHWHEIQVEAFENYVRQQIFAKT